MVWVHPSCKAGCGARARFHDFGKAAAEGRVVGEEAREETSVILMEKSGWGFGVEESHDVVVFESELEDCGEIWGVGDGAGVEGVCHFFERRQYED